MSINLDCGYIICWDLDNVSDTKRVRFVRDITLGVNHSCSLPFKYVDFMEKFKMFR